MSNDVKWTDWRSFDVDAHPAVADPSKIRSAWLQLAGCVLGLAALATVLPSPWTWPALLAGVELDAAGRSTVGATAEAAILVTAALLVWGLLVWGLTIGCAAVAGRLPGTPGRGGRVLLDRIAPAAAGRLIAAAVGASLLAGTSACAVPVMTTVAAESASETSATSSTAPLTAPAAQAPATGGAADPGDSSERSQPSQSAPRTSAVDQPGVLPVDEVIASIVIDWPDAAAQSPGSSTETTSPTAASVASELSATTDRADPADQAEQAGQADPPTSTSTSTSTSTETPPGPPTDSVIQEAPAPPTPASPTPASPASPPGPPSAGDSAAVTVRAGDTLWSIAGHRLPPNATDVDIDSAWRAWYSANSQVIGVDPDLIQPGQLLLPPEPEMDR